MHVGVSHVMVNVALVTGNNEVAWWGRYFSSPGAGGRSAWNVWKLVRGAYVVPPLCPPTIYQQALFVWQTLVLQIYIGL
jgi:hypothetical protein